MPARRQLQLTAAAFAAAAAILLVGCSSGGSDSAGPSPTPTPHTPSATAAKPPTTQGTPGQTATPGTAGPSRPATVPELGITRLRPGGTITLPATVGYTITGLHFTASAGYRLRMALGGPGSYRLDLPLDGPVGTVTIPLDKMLPGRRDLSFTVVREGGKSAWPAQRAADVADVTVYGPK